MSMQSSKDSLRAESLKFISSSFDLILLVVSFLPIQILPGAGGTPSIVDPSFAALVLLALFVFAFSGFVDALDSLSEPTNKRKHALLAQGTAAASVILLLLSFFLLAVIASQLSLDLFVWKVVTGVSEALLLPRFLMNAAPLLDAVKDTRSHSGGLILHDYIGELFAKTRDEFRHGGNRTSEAGRRSLIAGGSSDEVARFAVKAGADDEKVKKRDKAAFQRYWDDVVSPTIDELISLPGVRKRPGAKHMIWECYKTFNKHVSVNYMARPTQAIDRHKVAACYAFAVLFAEPLEVDFANGNSKSRRANEYLALILGLSVLQGFLIAGLQEMVRLGELDNGRCARAVERVRRGVELPQVGYGGTLFDSIMTSFAYARAEGQCDILMLSILFYLLEREMMEPEDFTTFIGFCSTLHPDSKGGVWDLGD